MSLLEGLSEKIVSRLFQYGKLGLLVEDAPDAELRTARELYAADGLPAWWIQIDNLVQAEEAIRETLAATGLDGPAWARKLPLLVILDRYLKAEGEGGASQVVSWDSNERKASFAVSLLRQAVKELEDECQRRPSWVVEKITSYPGEPAVPTKIPWKSRQNEPLFDLRKVLEKRAPDLLSYGPTLAAPARKAETGPTSLSQDQWRYAVCRARHWHTSVTELATALFEGVSEVRPPRRESSPPGPLSHLPPTQSPGEGETSTDLSFSPSPGGGRLGEGRGGRGVRTPRTGAAFRDTLFEEKPKTACVLFTGAGASFGNHRLAPGIPPTWFLLEWACWSVCVWRERADPHKRSEPIWPARQKPRGETAVKSLSHLIDLYLDPRQEISVAELDWEPLENLFKPRPKEKDLLNDFIRAFRHILQRYDHGFPYHSWLLARLPWTLVVTTNFDAFHERAAGAAVSSTSTGKAAFVYESFRRLGYLLPDVQETKGNKKQHWGPRTFEELRKGPGLFKPYGSLTTMGPLALALEDFWTRVKPIGHCFDLIRKTCDECWLVVVGHGMASPALDGTLVQLVEEAGAKKGFSVRVLWVDPDCCRLATERRAYLDFRGRFESFIDDAAAQGRHRYHPIPAHALHFSYDLWQEYLRLKEARAKPGPDPAG